MLQCDCLTDNCFHPWPFAVPFIINSFKAFVTMAISRFQAAINASQTYEVEMNQVQLLIFNLRPLQAIGTRNLNGCTAVVIISPFAAILSHIPPQPYLTEHPGVGMQNVRARMEEVLSLYRQNL